jgi:hypothetical protein
MGILLSLIACPAEQLGVELPEGGARSISQEDLQRDVFAMTHEDRGVVFGRRLEQMHVDGVERAEDRVCGRRDGAGNARILVARWSDALEDTVEAAALISLAKGWDGAKAPARTTWLCLAKEGAALPEGERVPLPTFTAGEAVEAVNWRVVQKEVEALFSRLD